MTPPWLCRQTRGTGIEHALRTWTETGMHGTAEVNGRVAFISLDNFPCYTSRFGGTNRNTAIGTHEGRSLTGGLLGHRLLLLSAQTLEERRLGTPKPITCRNNTPESREKQNPPKGHPSWHRFLILFQDLEHIV